jgi:hypothetical protein
MPGWRNVLRIIVHNNRVNRTEIKAFFLSGDRDSAVGVATRYGLVGPGSESQWGRDFPHPSRPALGPTQTPIEWVPDLSRGWRGRGVELATTTPSSARANQRVELYLYSHLALHGLQGPLYHFPVNTDF